MGEWHKVGERKKTPCDECQVGWGAFSSRTNKKGELETKSDSCSETCQLWKDFCKRDLVIEVVTARKDALLELAKY